MDQQGRHASTMTNDKATPPMRPAPATDTDARDTSERETTAKVITAREPAARETRRSRPEWADGLKQLYDSVVNEPLPDSFADLISKLDDTDK